MTAACAGMHMLNIRCAVPAACDDGELHAYRYVADFVEQFSPQTGVRPIAFEELQAVFRGYYDGGEEARVPLWSLYEGLLAFLLAVRCRLAAAARSRA